MSDTLWCNRQITVRVQGPDGERTIDVGKPYARIGSHARSDVILEGPGVPRLGFYLHATKRGIFLKPLVTMLDGQETCGRWLSPDCAVEVGEYRFFASFTDGAPPVAGHWLPLDEKGSAELPVPVIYILVNEARRATYRAYRQLTVVGREKPSALRLRSEFISLTHCVLYWDQGRLWFVDLFSANGTERRGRRRDAGRLRLGHTIKLGDVRLGLARTSDEPWVEPLDPGTDRPEPRSSESPPPDEATALVLESFVSPPETSWSDRDELDKRNSRVVGRAAAPTQTVALTSSHPEAIADMQRQLEAERTAWKAERDQERRVLRTEHEQIDKHFAEIQSWRDELNHRSHQLQQDFSQLADTSHELVRQREVLEAAHAAIADQRAALDREREELEQLRENVRQSRWELEDRSQEQARLLATRTEDLERRQTKLEQDIHSLAEEREQLERQKRLVESREEEIVQMLQQAEQGTEQSVARVAARITELEQRTAELHKLAAELDQRGVELNVRSAELTSGTASWTGETLS
jgi:hypothetical protein